MKEVNNLNTSKNYFLSIVIAKKIVMLMNYSCYFRLFYF